MKTQLSGTWISLPIVMIEDYNYPLYHHYVRFLYTGSLDLHDLTQAVQLLSMANYFSEEQLKHKCGDYIITHMIDTNCCVSLYKFGIEHFVPIARTIGLQSLGLDNIAKFHVRMGDYIEKNKSLASLNKL